MLFLLNKSKRLIMWHYDTQHNDTQHNDTEHNDTILSIMTFSIKGLFATLNINDIQHNNTIAIVLSFIMLNVAFYLLLY
jgi:hypothetical protein